VRNILLIAKREYLQKIRGRAFRLSTVLLPLLIMLLLGGQRFLARSSRDLGRNLAIESDNAALANDVREDLLQDKDANYVIDVVAPATAEEHANLLQQLHNKSIVGLLSIDTSNLAAPKATFITTAALPGGLIVTTTRLQVALNRALLRQRLAAVGVQQGTANSLMKQVDIETLQLNDKGKASKDDGLASIYEAVVMAFLIVMPILLYGMDTARSIVEEKSSRIFEVMLSIVRPNDMLTGKLIGVSGVGLTQITIWVLAAVALFGSAMGATLLRGDFSIHFTVGEALLFPVYFLLGFFLYCAFFSGLASTCETAQDLQMYMPLAALPVWFAFGVLPFTLGKPNSPWTIFASLFPPTASFVMLPRIAVDNPPPWQIAASITLLLLTIWATLWFSSRLYRIGILMYGKRATLPELLRWLRYS
jgi:ABC-2 type transport system permease protein